MRADHDFCWLGQMVIPTCCFRADDPPIVWSSERPLTLNYNDVLLSLLAAVAMGSLAGLGLIKTDKDEPKFKARLDTADVDTVALTAIVTFIAFVVALHPEWLS